MPSLLEALEQKYGDSSTDSEDSENETISVAIFVPCKSPRIMIPSLLVLNDCNIATAGEKEALVAKCAFVEELDLAKNKLKDWPEVFCILQQMPRLKFVNLSFNQLSTPLSKSNINLDKDLRWQQLQNLVLNSTHIGWESVQELLDRLPSLEELHLSLNNYDNVKLCDEIHTCCDSETNMNAKEKEEEEESNNGTLLETKCSCAKTDQKRRYKHNGIRKLHFTGNPVTNWKEICKLGYAFPKLESLVAAECPIETLDIDDESIKAHSDRNNDEQGLVCECGAGGEKESPHGAFRFLKFLNLNCTKLSRWEDIERLSKFPALHCVRIQGCPLWDEYTEHERRQLLIARLPNVSVLNGGGMIGPDEREDAERAFIRYYMDKPECERPERYEELVSIHGKLDPLVNIDLRPEKRVKVVFTCGTKSEIRSVDVYRTVGDLKFKLEQFAGFPASKMKLFYVDQDFKDIQGPEEMRFPHKQLYSYNISSGDEIIVDSKKKIVVEK